MQQFNLVICCLIHLLETGVKFVAVVCQALHK